MLMTNVDIIPAKCTLGRYSRSLKCVAIKANLSVTVNAVLETIICDTMRATSFENHRFKETYLKIQQPQKPLAQEH